MSQTEIYQTQKPPEEVIIQDHAPVCVDDEARKEQAMRELASCGMLRRDSPGATDENIELVEAILNDRIDTLRGGGTLTNLDLLALADDPKDEESISKSQRKENAEILASFCKEYGPKVREALVKAMGNEINKRSDDDQFIATFTTLADWDFMVKCENEKCNGKFRSNKLYMKPVSKDRLPSSPKKALKEKYETKTCPSCGDIQKKFGRHRPINEDSSNPDYGKDCFEEISNQILEALLIQTCTTRYEPDNKYMAVIEGTEVPILVQVSENGKMRELSNKISQDKKFIGAKAIEAANIARLVLEANDSRPEGIAPISIRDEEGNQIQITRSSGSGGGVFYARGNVVRDDIARRLRGFREDESGENDVLPGTGETHLEHWSTTMATDIIFALESTKKKPIGLFDWGNPTQANNMEEGWMLKLSREVTDFIDDNFEVEELSKFYSEETVPPMVYLPVDWELDDEHIAIGGFVTNPMQSKMPIIPREKIHRRLGMDRIEITKQSLEALNKTQRTAFRVNEEMLPLVRETMIEQVRRSASDSVVLKKDELNTGSEGPRFVLEVVSDNISHPSSSSYSEWAKELDYAKSLLDDQASNGRFYHPLRMDHRGRVYTSSTLLDPQGDDVSRGLIEFDSALPLTEEGWEWLRRATAKAWEGIGVSDALGNLQVLVEGKSTFSELLIASEKEDFISTMRLVSDDPLGTMNLWASPDGKSDIMRSHAEGFQRLAATKAFIRALDSEGGPIGSICRHVVVHDASSNIYQHNSMLILDRDMARKVNVLESDTGMGPNDAYTLIGDRVGEDEEFLHQLLSLGFDEKNASKIRASASARNLAKSPVMVTGYGAGKDAIVEKYLTHNGKSKKEGGKLGWFRLQKDEDYFKDFENTLKETSKSIDGLKSNLPDIIENIPANRRYRFSWKRDMTSHLRNALNLPDRASSNLNDEDRNAIVENHSEGIRSNEAVGDESMTIQELQHILVESGLPTSGPKKVLVQRLLLGRHEAIENLFSILNKPPIQMCAHRESQMASIVGVDNQTLHEPVARATTAAYLRSMRQVLPNYDCVKNELKRLLKAGGSWPLEWQPGPDDLKVLHRVLIKPDSDPVKRKQGQKQDGKSPGSLTRKVYRSHRDRDAEARAIAPNFVHSIDAAHMRQVAEGLYDHQLGQEQPPQFWMVHDAFGTHPNHVGPMREIVREKLKGIYFEWEINHQDLAVDAYKAQCLVIELGKCCQELADVSEEAAAELIIDTKDKVFIDNKPFAEKIARVSELMGLTLEGHAALMEDEASGLSLVKLKARCKERGFKGYSKLNKAELMELLSFPVTIVSTIPESSLESIASKENHNLEDQTNCLHCKANEFINSIQALSNLSSMLEATGSIEVRNILDCIHMFRVGLRLFSEKPINGIGSLDLNEVTSVGDMGNWYFLS